MSFYIILLFYLSGQRNQSNFFTVFRNNFTIERKFKVTLYYSFECRNASVVGNVPHTLQEKICLWSLYMYVINSVFFAVKYMFILEFLCFS